MSRISLDEPNGFMLILVLGSFFVAAMTATAANAAPPAKGSVSASATNSPIAPKGASVGLKAALKGVRCSELNDGEWCIASASDAELERLDADEAALFDAVTAKWAKKACATTKGEGE